MKVVLAYSGGLDTSVAIRWLGEAYGAEVVTLTASVGDGKDIEAIRRRALAIGAVDAVAVDVREPFLTDYAFSALKAGALYEGQYPLASALSRPLIARLLVEVARQEGAQAVAHGCTGKGNDQVRFDVTVAALAPDLKVIAPVREWSLTRDQELEYAAEHGIPVDLTPGRTYSIDQNLWGRSIECGPLEDPWAEPPADAFLWTVDPTQAPDRPEDIQLDFEAGIPVALDGERLDPVSLVSRLNALGGAHGVGRIDMLESRLVGIKSRELYEAPAAVILHLAHRELEHLVLPRELLSYLAGVSRTYAELVYNGLWHSPLKDALDAFVTKTQERVTGTVRIRLYKGTAQVVGRRSPLGLYDYGLATYDRGDQFDHQAAPGFIALFGLPTRTYARVGAAAAPTAGGYPGPSPPALVATGSGGGSAAGA